MGADTADSLPVWLHAAVRQVAATSRQGRLAHALLIHGPAGIGKQRLAEHLARLLLCRQPVADNSQNLPAACGACPDCRQLQSGFHPDRLTVMPEEGKEVLSIDRIRAIPAFLQLSRHSAAVKVAIITPADAMNRNAANALLKTLEEPPANSVLLLVSSRPGQLPATLRSRTQLLPIARPGQDQASAWLVEQGVDAASAGHLLELTGNAPMAALEWTDGKAPDFDNWQASLQQLLQGQSAVAAFAEQFRDDNDAQQLLAWLERQCRQALRQQLAAEPATSVFAGQDLRTLIVIANRLQSLQRLRNRNLRWPWQLAGLLYDKAGSA